jgi:CubicO group peptidase (beta-lactamase class C family)
LNRTRRHRAVATTTALALLCLGPCATLWADPGDVDRYIEMQMRQFHIPGISMAVVRDGRILKTQAYGTANVELAVPVTRDTVFEIGSMTKQFTAAAVMMLVEEGRVRLDDRLSEYLPDVPAAWSGITIRHLLTHTSGINTQDIDASKLWSVGKPAVLGAFYKLPLEFQPGEAWVYCNKGYNVLGVVIERASGKSYADFLAERIFKPLGMLASTVSQRRVIIPGRAAGYKWQNGELENRLPVPDGAFSGGAIVSTPGDLARWDLALDTGKLLKRASLEQMWAPVKLADGSHPAFEYGFGWFTDTYHGRRVARHCGVSPGFSSSIIRFVDDKLTVIVLANGSGQVIDQLTGDIAAIYNPALAIATANAPDPDARRSQKLKDALVGMLGGKPDPTLFTPGMNLFMTTASGKDFGEWAASFGPLESFTFAEQEETEHGRVVRYRVTLGSSRFSFSFGLAEDGKIAHAFFW